MLDCDWSSDVCSSDLGTAIAVRLTILILPLLLILASGVVGVVCLWQEALQDRRFRVAGDTLSLTGAARFSVAARDEVQRLGLKAAGRSLLDPWLLTDLRREYEQSPWVKRVCRLSRVFPNRIAVEFVLRVPAAQVHVQNWYWLVDQDGVLLRVAGAQTPYEGLPEIVGTIPGSIDRQPAYGQTWNDPAVRDALSVLQVLRDSPLSEDLHVRRVLVHRGSFLDQLECRRQQRPRLDLQTSEGVLVRWGTFNGGDLPGELRSADKVTMLSDLLRRQLAVPGICLDVRTRVPGYALPQE
jgi:hypothetical protein